MPAVVAPRTALSHGPPVFRAVVAIETRLLPRSTTTPVKDGGRGFSLCQLCQEFCALCFTCCADFSASDFVCSLADFA